MQLDNDRTVFLSTQPATRQDHVLAFAVVGVSSILFALAAPFAGVPLTPIPAFVASYQSALAINDLITAILLFSQFAILRSWAMLLLASAYLFTAAAAIVHGLPRPGTADRKFGGPPGRRCLQAPLRSAPSWLRSPGSSPLNTICFQRC